MIKNKFLPLFFFSIGLLVSCDEKRVYDQYKTISDSWNENEEIDFVLPQLDTAQTYNLFINVRNNNEFRYSNLFLISKMKFPNGKVIIDTLEYEMAAPDGKWLGAGFSDLKESKLWYKEGVLFKEEGVYTVQLQHAMRKNGEVSGISSLEGITDIGFRIEFVQTP